MATVGVNGAAAASLNERFIKCAGCKVNVPKEDMLALGKCTVCGRAYTPEAAGDAVIVETVAFAREQHKPVAAPAVAAGTNEKPKRKRWMELKSKRGRTYWHNTDTGEDTWVKPVDIDAEAVGNDGFVPFKNDAVKNAVLREQAKMDATKMGLPAEVIATLQQQQLKEQQQEAEQDPFNAMLKRPAAQASAQPPPAPTTAPAYHSRLEGIEDHDDHQEEDDDEEQETKSSRHDSEASPAKQSSCCVMDPESETEAPRRTCLRFSASLPSLMKLSLAVLVLAAAASLCAAQGCPEDALICRGGKVLQRDPKNHCEFPECPEDKHDDRQKQTKQRSKSFTFSAIHG